MPWVFPDSPESYLRLLRAIDRKAFGVHLDPVNLIAGPRLYYDNAALLRKCFETLGPSIKSCHAKDVILAGRLTVHLDETRPGLGGLDYRVFLEGLNRLDPDTPLMLEHLSSEEEYRRGADFIRSLEAEIS
jgi:sugar phosphate isomerase/epimerase